MFTLFPDEKIVTQSNDESVTLTTHRICYAYKDWGRSYNQNIMLEHVTSCENYYTSTISFLVLAVLVFLGGIIGSKGDFNVLGPTAFIALLFGIAYWTSRKSFVVVSSPSTRMEINVNRMKRENILAFMNLIEETKHKRVLTLSNVPNRIV